ncbi:MAG: phosphotransferase enzyme family protein [Vibrio sp.]
MEMEQYDTLTDDEMIAMANDVLTRYLPEHQGTATLICRSENATFKVSTEREQFALRIHRPDYHDAINIQSELAWLAALEQQGFVVPMPVADKNGIQVQPIEVSDQDRRFAVLFRWIEGSMPTTDIEPEQFEPLGEIMARLHLHSIHWPRPAWFKRLQWDHSSMVGEHGHWGHWRKVSGLSPADIETVQRAVDNIAFHVQHYGKESQTYGLIHADLRLTNLLFHHGMTRAIDFDDCGEGWFMHDIAAAISFYEHHENAEEWMSSVLRGYQKVRPLSQRDLDILPVMVMQRRIQLLAWVGSHQQTEMAQSLGEHWVAETVRLCQDYLRIHAKALEAVG